MITTMYVVFDSCAARYDRPFIAHSDGEATRSFGDVCMDANHPFGQHPEHYSLHKIGTYNDENAEIVLQEKVCVCTGLEMVALARKVDPLQMDALEVEVNKTNGVEEHAP